MRYTKFLNIELANITQEELLLSLKKGVLVTPNVDHLVKLQYDREYYNIVKKAEWVVCDSRILYICSLLTNSPLRETIPGSSFFPQFYEYHKNDMNCKIFLLGGMDGVAQVAMDCINKKIGRKIVVDAYSPSYGFEKNQDENEQIYEMINNSEANVVLVGLGCPKQEKWIFTHKDKMPNVDIWMALGATIDFEAGKMKRSPQIIQKLCLEWFYRFLQEPRRMFKRYFVDDIKFIGFFTKQLLGIYRNPFESHV